MSVLNNFEICNPADPDIIQSYPDVVYNGENYQVVWSDEKYGVYYATAGRVSPGGVVLDTGICISTGSGSYEYQPKIAFDGDRCFVVWPKDLGVQGRFINHNGQPEGLVLSVTTNGSGPVLAYGADNYLVTWFSGTYPTLNIKARLFSVSGVPLGSEITLTTDGDCNRWPDVIYDGCHFVVVWMKGANSPAAQYVWAQAISTAGSMIGGNFPVSANTSDQRWFPSVVSSDTNYFIVWGQSGANMNIMGNVDYGLVGIGEVKKITTPAGVYSGPTVMKQLPAHISDGKYRIFDVSGREMSTAFPQPGVYFVALDGGDVLKITIVR